MKQIVHWRTEPYAAGSILPIDRESLPTLAEILFKDHPVHHLDDGQMEVLLHASERHTEYLRGLADAGVPGARELYQALVAHGRLRVWTKQQP